MSLVDMFNSYVDFHQDSQWTMSVFFIPLSVYMRGCLQLSGMSSRQLATVPFFIGRASSHHQSQSSYNSPTELVKPFQRCHFAELPSVIGRKWERIISMHNGQSQHYASAIDSPLHFRANCSCSPIVRPYSAASQG